MAVWVLLCLARTTQAYQIVTVLGEKEFCNDTVWVDGGAILRLTDKPAYTFTPFTCFITFMAPQHTWSGLIGVLEDVNLRKYHDEADHHMAQNQCVDYIKVVTDTGMPQGEQCGTWGVGPGQQLSQMGYQRALVGYCPTPPDNGASDMRCGVSKLTVQVSVGMKDNPVWRHKTWPSHRGFTFVVTSYRYQYRESECAADLRSCSDGNGDPPYCVHHSLWCDRHINCGHPLNNLDETSCLHHEMLDNVLTVLAGPWVVVMLLLGVLVVGATYWRRTRLPIPAHHPITVASYGAHPAQEMNSYAESYEVSSTLPTASHMDIQVRVVCSPGQLNSNNHHHHNYQLWPGSTTTTTTTIDLPPAYDSLFPHGPPPPPPAYPSSNSSHSLNPAHSPTNVNASTTTTTPTTTSATTTVVTTATATITTTSQLSLAVNNNHHNSASLSTTIVASAESANAEATTTTTIGLGTNTVTTTAAPTNIPPPTTTTTIPCLNASPSSSMSAITTTTIRGPTPTNVDKSSSDLSELEEVEIAVDECSKPQQLPQPEPPPLQASHFLPELRDLPPHDAEYPPSQPQPPPRPTHSIDPDPHQPPPTPQPPPSPQPP